MPATILDESVVARRVRLTRPQLVIGGIILLVIIAVVSGIVYMVLNWPFTRQRLIDALQESSARSVVIDRFHQTYFPPGCTAEGIHFLHRKHKNKPPLIEIQKLTIVGSYSGMIGSPKHLKEVHVDGMHVTVPPRNPDGSNPVMPLTDVKSARPIVIGTVLSDKVVLDFVNHEGQPVYQLVIDQLVLDGVGNNQTISYRAQINTSEPPGVIKANGQFGPWVADDPGRTVLKGSYTYEKVNLGVFKDLGGVLSSHGDFSGTLDRVNVRGQAQVPNLHIHHAGHTGDISTDFQAVVDGTHGNTLLENVQAHLNDTTVISKGTVAGHEGQKGKTVDLELFANKGRIEDILDMVLASKRPPITGVVSVKARAIVPPQGESFLRKLLFDGDFGLDAGKFTSQNTQGTLNKLSASAHGHLANEDNPETALSDLKGHVSAKDGIATLKDVSFRMPGATAKIHGTYNLVTEQCDLHGVLTTEGKIYVTQQGFKSLLLRGLTPFLKHKSHSTIVPFKITGTYPNATVALDLFRKK